MITSLERLSEMDEGRIYHVYPQFGREHVTNRLNECWCRPRVEFEGDGAIIIHEADQ